jgi:hypothetical protein
MQRELTHAPLAGGRTHFLDGGQLFKFDFTRFLTAFSVVKTYVSHSPYKYTSNLHHFLHHHLTFSPPHSLILFLLQQQCFSIIGLSYKETSLKISGIVWTDIEDGNALQRRLALKVFFALDKKHTLPKRVSFYPKRVDFFLPQEGFFFPKRGKKFLG